VIYSVTNRPYIRLKKLILLVLSLSIILAGKEFQSLTELMKKELYTQLHLANG